MRAISKTSFPVMADFVEEVSGLARVVVIPSS
jgi:hypothetical protein